MEENFEKPKKKILPIIIIAVVLVLLIGGAFAYYTFVMNNPKKIINTAIDKAFAKLEIKEEPKTQKVSVGVSAKVETKDDDLKEIIDTYKIDTAQIILNMEMDAVQEYFKENIIAKYDGEQLIDADIILQDEKIYLFVEEIFDKYIDISDNIEEQGIDKEQFKSIFATVNKLSVEEENKLIKEIQETIKEFLKNREFTKEKSKLEIANKEESVKKSSVILTQKEVYKLSKKVLETLKNNEFFIGLFDEIQGSSIEEILEDEISFIEEIIEDNEDSVTTTFSVYTKGFSNEFVKAEFIVADEDSESCVGLSYTIEDGENSKIEILENRESAKTSGLENVVTVDVKKKDKTVTFSIKTEEFEDFTANIVWTKTTDQEGILQIILDVPSEAMNYQYDNTKVTVNLGYSIDTKSGISKQNTNNSVKTDDFTEEDVNEILTNFQSSKIYELIEEFGLLNNRFR